MNTLGYIIEGFTINDIVIKEDIFNNELYDYKIIDRAEEIDNLCTWIAESSNESEKYLMLEDLRQLQNSDDEYILSSIDTNEYIDSTFGDIFNDHCEAILELNK